MRLFIDLTNEHLCLELQKRRKIYKKHTLKWYQHFFCLEERFDGYRIRLFGINSKLIPYKKVE